LEPVGFQTRQTQIAVRAESHFQTGSKIQSGRFQSYFSIILYRYSIFDAAATATSPLVDGEMAIDN
jgi:hypothetical protein